MIRQLDWQAVAGYVLVAIALVLLWFATGDWRALVAFPTGIAGACLITAALERQAADREDQNR